MSTVFKPERPTFPKMLELHGLMLGRRVATTLQVNVGKRCNQACHHCHVDAGPLRTEIMDEKTIMRVITLMDRSREIRTLDITGGAPELNPHFRTLVRAGRERGLHVIDRCNLTVLSEPGQEETAAFLAGAEVHIIASLPCYSKENVERQRGKGVFEPSIQALRALNALGYGHDPLLPLDLVYNPVGPTLPPEAHTLEQRYKAELGIGRVGMDQCQDAADRNPFLDGEGEFRDDLPRMGQDQRGGGHPTSSIDADLGASRLHAIRDGSVHVPEWEGQGLELLRRGEPGAGHTRDLGIRVGDPRHRASVPAQPEEWAE